MNRSKEGPQYRLKFNDSIILVNKKKFTLLNYIDECGSIMNASKRASIPYRSALKYIEEMKMKLTEELYPPKGVKRWGWRKQTYERRESYP
jgi:molybdate transport system regulatory protein